MGLNDTIKNSRKKKLKFINQLVNVILIDLKNIKNYYLNLFSFYKFNKNKILFYFLVPTFYSILLFTDLFWKFLIIKFLFYFVKYILKYIFMFFDYIYFKYLPQNKYLKFFYDILYKISIKVIYMLYYILFLIVPQLIYSNFWKNIFETLKSISIVRIHLFLDFIESIPTSKFVLMSITYSIYLKRKIRFLYTNVFTKEVFYYFYYKCRNFFDYFFLFPYKIYLKTLIVHKCIFLKYIFLSIFYEIKTKYKKKYTLKYIYILCKILYFNIFLFFLLTIANIYKCIYLFLYHCKYVYFIIKNKFFIRFLFKKKSY
jgi:hypothetical protein